MIGVEIAACRTVCIHTGSVMMARMATTPRKKSERRRRRPDNGGVCSILQARVDPEIKALADAGAAARQVTLSVYMQELIKRDELAREYLALQEAQEELDLEMGQAS